MPAWILLHAVASLEPLHPSGGIDQLLLAGEERMASGADLGVDLLDGGTGLEGIATKAFYGHFLILGVNSLFH